jgi:hypothetical protein
MEEDLELISSEISKFNYLPLSILKKSEFLKSIIPSNVNYFLIEDVLPLIFGISICDFFTTYKSNKLKFIDTSPKDTSSYLPLYNHLNLVKFIFYKFELIIEDKEIESLVDDFIDYPYLNIMIEISRLLLLPEEIIFKIRKQIFRNLLIDDNYTKLKIFCKNYENEWNIFKNQIKQLMKYHYSGSSFFKKNNLFKNSNYLENSVPLFNEMIRYYSSQHSNELNILNSNIYINVVYVFLLNI